MRIRLAALCGIASPIASTLGWLVGEALQPPGYNPAVSDISDLGARGAAHPWVLNVVGSNLAGALAVVFAVGLYAALDCKRWTCLAGPLLVAVFGAGEILDGVFRLDCETDAPSCPAATSWREQAHTVESFVTVWALLLAPVACALCFRRLREWRPLVRYSLATSLVVFALLCSYPLVYQHSGGGIVQRVFATLLVLWIGVVAGRVLVLSGRRQMTFTPRLSG